MCPHVHVEDVFRPEVLKADVALVIQPVFPCVNEVVVLDASLVRFKVRLLLFVLATKVATKGQYQVVIVVDFSPARRGLKRIRIL